MVNTGNFSSWRDCDLVRDLAKQVQNKTLFFQI